MGIMPGPPPVLGIGCPALSAVQSAAGPSFIRNRIISSAPTTTAANAGAQYISVSLLHEAIIQQLDHNINAGVPLDYTVTHANRERSGELFRLHATLSDLQRRDSRLLDAYLAGALSLEQFSAAKASLDKSTQETQALIADAESAAASSEDAAAVLIASLKKTRDTLAAPDAPPEDKNDALRDITERIVFNKAAWTLDITYRLIL